ncbi:hypothetical protein Acal02_02699 [Acinetobacter calcoaceticus]
MISMIFPILIIGFLIVWAFNEYNKFGISLLFMALIWSMVIYGLAPLALMSSYNEVASPRFLVNNYDIGSFFPFFVSIIFFISMYIGSIIARSVSYKIYLESTLFEVRKVTIVLFLIGFFCLSFFIYAYGGLDYVLSNMSQIRSGVDDNKNYLAAFLNSFSKYINFSFFIVFALFLLRESKSKYDVLLLLVTGSFTFFSVYLSAGREAGIALLIALMVIYISIYKKVPILIATLFLTISIFYILFAKTFLFALNNENFDRNAFMEDNFSETIFSSYNIIVSEFSHQYLSLVNFMQRDFDFRFFGDYAYWVFKPFKLLGVDIPDSISYYNTYNIYGVWDSEIPPGAIAFGYIQFGIVGVIIHGLILGVFFKFFDIIFDAKNQKNPILLAFYAVTVTSFTYMLSNSDPALFLQNRIPNILFFIVLFVFFKVRLVKR